MVTDFGRAVNYHEGLPHILSNDTLIRISFKITWQTNIIISPLPKCLLPPKVTGLRLTLRIHWGLLEILEISNKSVQSNVFWYAKVYIFWKCIQYTIHSDKTQISKNSLRTKWAVQKCSFFLSRAPTHYSFTFNLRFLNELKHKARLFTTVCGISHFWFPFVFIKFIFLFIKVQELFDFKTSQLLSKLKQ